MQKLNYFLLCFLLGLITFSCQNDVTTEETTEVVTDNSDNLAETATEVVVLSPIEKADALVKEIEGKLTSLVQQETNYEECKILSYSTEEATILKKDINCFDGAAATNTAIYYSNNAPQIAVINYTTFDMGGDDSGDINQDKIEIQRTLYFKNGDFSDIITILDENATESTLSLELSDAWVLAQKASK